VVITMTNLSIVKERYSFSSDDAEPCTGEFVFADDGDTCSLTGLSVAIPMGTSYELMSENLASIADALVDTFAYQLAGNLVLGGLLTAVSATSAIISIDSEHTFTISVESTALGYAVELGAEGVEPRVYHFGDVPVDGVPLMQVCAYGLTHYGDSPSATMQDLNAKAASIRAMVAGKQDLLTAGENITIEDNVISASGGGSSIEINASFEPFYSYYLNPVFEGGSEYEWLNNPEGGFPDIHDWASSGSFGPARYDGNQIVFTSDKCDRATWSIAYAPEVLAVGSAKRGLGDGTIYAKLTFS